MRAQKIGAQVRFFRAGLFVKSITTRRI